MDEARQREIARALSTKANARESDFSWLIERAYSRPGSPASKAAPKDTVRIADMPLLLNGGWKCFLCGEGDVYTGTDARLLNAEIQTDGNAFTVLLNWWRVINPSVEGIENEEGTTACKGKWNAKTASVHTVADIGNVDLTDFYLAKNKDAEYAVGTLTWSSGEVDNIGLMRTLSNEASKEDTLIQRAMKRSGAPEAELTWNADGTATIHLFESIDDGNGESHISTWDWYTIAPDTMMGTDFLEMPVDLSN